MALAGASSVSSIVSWPGVRIEKCVISSPGCAPCQWRSPAGINTTSPASYLESLCFGRDVAPTVRHDQHLIGRVVMEPVARSVPERDRIDPQQSAVSSVANDCLVTSPMKIGLRSGSPRLGSCRMIFTFASVRDSHSVVQAGMIALTRRTAANRPRSHECESDAASSNAFHLADRAPYTGGRRDR